jgi:hypothetical protein
MSRKSKKNPTVSTYQRYRDLEPFMFGERALQHPTITTTAPFRFWPRCRGRGGHSVYRGDGYDLYAQIAWYRERNPIVGTLVGSVVGRALHIPEVWAQWINILSICREMDHD